MSEGQFHRLIFIVASLALTAMGLVASIMVAGFVDLLGLGTQAATATGVVCAVFQLTLTIRMFVRFVRSGLWKRISDGENIGALSIYRTISNQLSAANRPDE